MASAWSKRGDLKRRLKDEAGALEDYEGALKVAPEGWPEESRVRALRDELRRRAREH